MHACGAEDSDGLPGEKGIGDAGDGGGENGLRRAQLLIGELAEEGAEGEGGSKGSEEDKTR